MSTDPPIPVCLIAGVTGNASETPGKAFRQECQLIRHHLSAVGGVAPKLVIVPDEQVYFPDLMRQYAHKPDLVILHLSGSVQGDYLAVSGTWGPEVISIDKLGQQIGRLSGLQAVVLGGCATPRLIELLLRRDIPLIIGFSARMPQRQVQVGIQRFYAALSQGSSLQEAAELVSQATSVPVTRAAYDLEADTFTWTDTLTSQSAPADGICWATHNEDRLTWRLTPFVGAGAEPPARRRVRLIGSLLLVGALLAGAGGLIWKFPFASLSLRYPLAADCQPDSAAYTLVLTPVFEQDSCHTSQEVYSRSLLYRSRAMLPSVRICYQPEVGCQRDSATRDITLRSSGADLLMVVAYRPISSDSLLVRLFYTATNTRQQTRGGVVEARVSASVFRTETPSGYGPVEDMIWSSMARFWEVREQYDSALQCWNRVQLLDRHLYLDSRLAAARCAQLLEDPSLAESYLSEALNLDSLYTEARLQRGLLQARQQNFMQALADFSYILMQEPAHPEARYNRAMLYFRAEKFDSAAADVTRLITDTPKDGRAHGLMAAIAAEQQDKGTCLVHLEQALLHGYPVQEIMDYVPAFRAYQQDPDFQALFKRVTGDSLDRGRLSP